MNADPLTIITNLAAAGLHEQFLVYERPHEWCYAGGAHAELTLDHSGAHLSDARGHRSLDWDGSPLRQVQRLLEQIDIPGWRAYGWAAFELAYAKEGDRSSIGDQRLLHLLIPQTEVRIDGNNALIRSTDEAGLDAVAACLADATNHSETQSSPLDVRHGAAAYQRAVADAVAAIHADRFQKVILSRTFAVDTDIDLVATYRHGRQANNPARSFLLHLGGIEAAGFSPEVVVAVDASGRVISQPLAGTRALTDDPVQNRRLRAELLSNSKEIYEHAISVKIAHDELLDVCIPDTLYVEEFMSVRERGTVQHLASRVAGQLAEGHHAWDAFAAVFPAVTASGVPKAAAYTGIRTHEPAARGLYSGAVLTVEHDGSMDAALVLRAVYRQHGKTWLQAGAGIVGDSRPEREFEETCEKLDSVARFLVPAPAPAPAHVTAG
ncbi:salicylate synthase [Nocardia barduliensis]|uniref:salicylate synthase n=1 Tax=Nocardia barduliensis TaxID=2736643 RepID=UPI001C2DC6E4|nr:salicylate synthase [Nocardia barduliensis]